MAETPETSEHTSIKLRVQALEKGAIPSQLMRFQGTAKKNKPNGIPFALKDYVELVEWSGRAIHPNKRGRIPENKPNTLKRLKISEEEWIELSLNFETNFSAWIGNQSSLEHLTSQHNLRHTAGSRRCRQAFAT